MAIVTIVQMSFRKWLPDFKPATWIQLLPLLIMFTLLWMSAWTPYHLSINTVKFWEYLIYGWLYAASVYLLGLIVLTRYLRAWVAAIFAWVYLLLYAVNGGFLYHMGTMLNPYFVWVAKPTAGVAYFIDYFIGWVLVLTVGFLLCGGVATWLIRKNANVVASSRLRWLVILAFLCWLAPVLRDAGIFNPSKVAVQA